jgi:hypothetical protein
MQTFVLLFGLPRRRLRMVHAAPAHIPGDDGDDGSDMWYAAMGSDFELLQ